MALRPVIIRVDICAGCQLGCPACPTGTGKTAETLGTGRMSLKNFKRILDDAPNVKHIELASAGEIFLNKELADILQHAAERRIKVYCNTGANLNNASPRALEAVVRYRLSSMTCAIDGASQDVYQMYRVGGNLERVLGHIRLINEFKKKYKSSYPRLSWQFLMFKHNIHERTKARSMAHALGMKFFSFNSWDSLDIKDHEPVTKRERFEYHLHVKLSGCQHQTARSARQETSPKL